MANCWHCSAPLLLVDGQVGFKAVCDGCGSWLHTCTGCRFYAPGKPNDCLIPGTDPVRDREAANFCDEFKVLTGEREKPADPDDIAKRLFGDD